MTAKKSLIIILRIFYVIFSLLFIKDAFYKWDGYSYFILFKEFLPDLAISFILWTILGVIFAIVFWLLTYGPPKILPRPLNIIRFEHTLVWGTLIVSLFVIKRAFDISLSNLGVIVGVSRFMIVIVGGVLLGGIIWFGRNYIEKFTEKILSRVNYYITPLLWIFVFSLVVAIPFSLSAFNRGKVDETNILHTINTPSTSNFNKGGRFIERKRPNIILLTWDAITARDMQVYGYSRPTTPFISEWAKDAILFKKAYSSGNWTPPTTMTLMTGQRPWTHRHWSLNCLYPFRRYEHNLPALLKENGYATYSFVQNVNAHPDALGIRHAFMNENKYYDFYSIPDGWNGFKLRTKFFLERLTNSPIAAVWAMEHPVFIPLVYLQDDSSKTLVPVEKVYDSFLEYMSRNPEPPFFAWLHLEPPHNPYLPPEPYMGMFGDAERFNTRNKQEKTTLASGEYDQNNPELQKEVRILKKRLDEYIVYCDQGFKLFLLRLTKVIDMSNTIIIFSSDHGTSLERGLVGHGTIKFYESQVHIPLIIKIPGKKGKVIDIPVEQIDIPPTILQFAGIPVPPWMEGRSLLPLIEGGLLKSRPVFSILPHIEGESLKPQTIFSGHFWESRAIKNHPIDKGSVAVWDGDYKLVYYLGFEDKKPELYNLKVDPDEKKNIVNEKLEVAQRLKKLVEKKLSYANKGITQPNLR